MSKSIKIYIAIIVVALTLAGVMDYSKPKQKIIDWTPSYDSQNKNPLGLYVLNNEIHNVLKYNTVEKIPFTPYEYLTKVINDSTTNLFLKKGTILKISEDPSIDSKSIDQLLYFAENGNTIFLSMKSLPDNLLDSLKINFKTDENFSKKAVNWCVNKNLKPKKYAYTNAICQNYFTIQNDSTTILGYQSINEEKPNFIKVPYKKGAFILHLQPVIFSNYYLLKDKNYEHAANVLSYIPQGNVYWFGQYNTKLVNEGSLLKALLKNPALRSAWYIFLIGLFIFILFNAKRKQRIVPIIKPLSNTTVDFVKTIGNLYFQEGNHSDLIDKKIIYFLEKIRTDYLIETFILDEKFIERLHQKSGKSKPIIEELVYFINKHRKNNFSSTEKDLLDMNAAIEKFYDTK
jgi:hypothetical protein